MRLQTVILSLMLLTALGASERSMILDDSRSDSDARITTSLRRSLFDAGVDLVAIKLDQLNASDGLRDVNLLVIPLARSISQESLQAIDRFLKSGGKLIACGLPLASSREQPSTIHIEGLYPEYQFFPISSTARIRTCENQSIVVPANFEWKSTELFALHPRPGGSGFGKNRPYRWQPLMEALSDKNEHRGTIAALIIPTTGERTGAAWACFTPTDSAFYARPDVSQMITDVARALRRGAFLREGGASVYTQFDDLPVTIGARSIKLHDSRFGELLVRTIVTQPGKNDPVYKKEWPISAPGTSFSERWQPREWGEQPFTITTELRADEMLVDRLVQRLHRYRIKQESPHFVSRANGGFELNGKPWKPHGVNYMPSSGIGLNDDEIYEHWLGAVAYDPEIIDRDLRRIRAMNLNAISVFIYHKSLAAWNLIDLLRRCDQYGVKVNLSLRPGTPIDFDWDQWKAIIEQQRLAKIDTIFAYDLAWEWTHWSREYQQKTYTPAWRKWVTKKYGTIAAAEKAWGSAAPRARDGEVDVPETKQLFEDGDWRKLAIDYRAFLDDFVAGRYGGARDLVRSIDPNHAVSFRMNTAGDPTERNLKKLPYDFWGLRDAVDIYEPEAYGRVGDWERVKPGRSTVSYARLCKPNLPVAWAEAGTSVWDRASMSAPKEKLAFQASFARDFYRMLIESGSDGVFWWWLPGGYRVNEKSDFGIINPDGTDRPVTKVIREEGAKFVVAPKPGAPDVWIEIDREKDARGLPGMYESVADEYWQAIKSGKHPGLKWANR